MLRVAIAQFRPDKGEYAANLARLGEVFREVGQWPEPPGLVVAPEAALTGYFLEGGVQELALSAEQLFDDLARVHRESGAPPLDIALGFYELWRNHLHNSALYASLGGPDAGIRHVHRKVFLPTYGVFDEERFVEPGRVVHAFDTRWGRCAMLVCEDAWHSIMPTLAALDGAEVILVPSATPARGLAPRPGQARPANLDRWDRLAQGIAEEHGVYVIVAHLVGFEGGKGFAGGSIVAGPRGTVLLQAPLFQPATVPVDLDFIEITRARAEAPLLSDLQVRLPHLLKSLENGSGADDQPVVTVPAVQKPAPRRAAPLASSSSSVLEIDPELTRTWLIEFLRDELIRRRKFTRAIVGISGGVDSSLVAFLAAEALGKENVIGVRMPYRTSSSESLDHAQLVVDKLGIQSRTVDISAGV
ncbi:MAG TPA: nitrilase-related carbon-nitrogen hydrolase, partial [Gemmatimonadales bacterium]|nr:nitrilase-related carbon-nitrogen hydrolase [Gemmatimonadales bacterium]